MLLLIDLFDDFAIRFESVKEKTPENVFKLWTDFYSNKKEDIKEICLNDYTDSPNHPFEVFTEHVYPLLIENWNEFIITHKNFKSLYKEIKQWFNLKYSIDEDFYFIFLVDLGNGAGWVTKYKNKHCIFLGAVNIVDLKWYDKEKFSSLILHEMAHVYHFISREKKGLKYDYDDGDFIWRLYAEGVAERFKQYFKKSDCYIERFDSKRVNWFNKNFSKLCILYYEYMIKNKKEYDFYGNWNDIEGYSESGYYIAPEFIKFIEKKYELELNDVIYLTYNQLKEYFYEFIKYNSIGISKTDVFLVEANPFWNELYNETKSELLKVLGDLVIKIEHIGSTSVDNLKSKPILDFLIAINFDNKELVINKLEELNYIFKGNIVDKDSLYFIKRIKDKTIHHLHIAEYDSEFWNRHLKFKNNLQDYPELKKDYENFKIELLKNPKINRKQYTENKFLIIEKILNK